MNSYYGKRSHATADLKRHAHAVRQAVDAKPIIVDPITGKVTNPRKARYIDRVSMWDGKNPYPREPPHLAPRARHAWAWGWR